MNIRQLNGNEISSIKGFINQEDYYYEYREERIILFFWKIKAGFYNLLCLGGGNHVLEEDILKSGIRFIKDKKVYYYPHLKITMSSGKTHTKWFKSEEELNQFMNTDEMKNIPWIKY